MCRTHVEALTLHRPAPPAPLHALSPDAPTPLRAVSPSLSHEETHEVIRARTRVPPSSSRRHDASHGRERARTRRRPPRSNSLLFFSFFFSFFRNGIAFVVCLALDSWEVRFVLTTATPPPTCPAPSSPPTPLPPPPPHLPYAPEDAISYNGTENDSTTIDVTRVLPYSPTQLFRFYPHIH